ncbi:TPA: Asp-tRNA(Asn)/Glu-tRNA(Gln) amidotransferase GatCAB subunit C [Candidatus Falkowbacteria bacterium]|nr:MAG: Aspartyl/glutamyl-tRNA(Asn/Gln) amidotransferase subunit C [Candidatus Falkowbacteria bacterium GW2011_GWF2_43_32]HBA36698.1 Asp-tRNA(Asn)/Glu-tRNA(Gln) amidotransferase GatCAB subunit C [Candidatus Falkowbacteria bacterium]
MSITREEIKHIAELSRLDLTAEETEKFGGQLDLILKYIGRLNEVDTKKIIPTAQVSGLVDVWRADDIREWDKEEVRAALEQGELEGGQIKVKRVL